VKWNSNLWIAVLELSRSMMKRSSRSIGGQLRRHDDVSDRERRQNRARRRASGRNVGSQALKERTKGGSEPTLAQAVAAQESLVTLHHKTAKLFTPSSIYGNLHTRTSRPPRTQIMTRPGYNSVSSSTITVSSRILSVISSVSYLTQEVLTPVTRT
jgi:hypothetical protein